MIRKQYMLKQEKTLANYLVYQTLVCIFIKIFHLSFVVFY